MDTSFFVILTTIVMISALLLQPRAISLALKRIIPKHPPLSYRCRLYVVLTGILGSLLVYSAISGVASLGGLLAKFFVLRQYIKNHDNDLVFVVATDFVINISVLISIAIVITIRITILGRWGFPIDVTSLSQQIQSFESN